MVRSTQVAKPYGVTDAKVDIWAAPNLPFVVGFPGLDNTQPRIEGEVTIRPRHFSAGPILISMVNIWLERREEIHPPSDGAMKLASKGKSFKEHIGQPMSLWRVENRPYAEVVAMNIPFRLILPRKNQANQTCPPASLLLRTASTTYYICVSVQYGQGTNRCYECPVPIIRYDTLTTLPMYSNKIPEPKIDVKQDISLQTRLWREAFGPGDPINIYVQLTVGDNHKKNAMLQKMEFYLEELITYHCDGLKNVRKPKPRRINLGEAGIPALLPKGPCLLKKELQMPERPEVDANGIRIVGSPKTPAHAHMGFTTTAKLYNITYFLVVKATLNKFSLINHHEVIVCPFDRLTCAEELAVAEHMSQSQRYIADSPPKGPLVVKPTQHELINDILGLADVDGSKRWVIE